MLTSGLSTFEHYSILLLKCRYAVGGTKLAVSPKVAWVVRGST